MTEVSHDKDNGGPPRFYSVHEAARILRISPMTVYRAISENEFPAVKTRRRFSIPAKAIDEMEAAAVDTRSVVDAATWVQR